MRYSACIEWLFADAAARFPGRIRAAKASGLDAVEFWRWSNKDLTAIRAALDDTGLMLAGILCEPIVAITDQGNLAVFAEGVRASLEAARRLGARMLIAQAGNDQHKASRAAQHAAIVRALKEAAPILEGSGVVLALEPLNDRVDHRGYYLTSTTEGLDIIDEVGRAEIRLLYDIYHSAMMRESIEEVLADRLDRVAHVHLADMPGRGAPGSGKMDWRARLDWLSSHGYSGLVGLEYRPSGGTHQSLRFRDI